MPFQGYNVAAESVSNVTATPSVELGTRRTVNGNDYIYVYNSGNAQISVGMPAGIGPNSMNSGYSVSVSNAASQLGGELVVGVCYHATLTTGTYGWLVTRGFCQGVPDASAVSMNSGDRLAIGVDGGFVSYPVSAGTGLIKNVPLGVCLNSFVTTPTAANNHIFFNSPLFG